MKKIVLVLLLFQFYAVSAQHYPDAQHRQNKRDTLVPVFCNGSHIYTSEIIDTNCIIMHPGFCQDTFQERVDFSRSLFDTVTEFGGATFKKTADFCKVRFQKFCGFSGTHFRDSAKFNYTHWDTVAKFSTAHFYSPALFSFAHFVSYAYFDWAFFDEKADFESVNFDGIADFGGATFHGTLVLKNINEKSVIGTKFIFLQADLPDTIDFSENPFIENNIDLTIANKSDRIHFINLYHSDVSKFHIDYSRFKLYFPRDEINGKDISKDEKVSIYEGLLTNFKIHNQMVSYEKLDIEYKNYLHGLNVLPYIWYCYGYKKWLIFAWALGFIIIFTCITYYKIDILTATVYRISKIPQLPSLEETKQMVLTDSVARSIYLRRLWFSFWYTAVIFFLFWLKIENLKFRNRTGVLYIILIYSVGLLCLGYIANFVIQK